MMHRSPKLLALARGMPCMMRCEHCNGNPETTVWCHLNGSEAGKGIGMKGHDMLGFFGCSNCHDWYDGRRWIAGSNINDRRAAGHLAHVRTLSFLLDNDMIRLLV